MKVLLASRSKASELLFSGVELSRLPPAEIDTALEHVRADSVMYIDFGSLPKKAAQELVSSLGASRSVHWAVLDRSRSWSDPAALFHAGAIDYLGPEAAEGTVNPARLALIESFIERSDSRVIKSRKAHRQATLPPWDCLVEGKAYDMLILYLGIWDADGMRVRLGENRFTRFKSSVLNLAASLIQEHGGILWITDDRSCLALFPPEALNGLFTSCMSTLAGMRLISYEQFRLEQEVGWLSFCFQTASVPWQKPGQTGKIISDALNYIYHLGRKFLRPCVIDLVDDTITELAPRLAALLKDAGSFESRPVHRFHGFVSGAYGPESADAPSLHDDRLR